MKPVNADKAEGTAALLQEAAHGGFPVMIPGGFEKRASRPRVTVIATAEPAPRRRVAGADDRERLEHEREGGGAPGQRTPAAVRSRP